MLNQDSISIASPISKHWKKRCWRLNHYKNLVQLRILTIFASYIFGNGLGEWLFSTDWRLNLGRASCLEPSPMMIGDCERLDGEMGGDLIILQSSARPPPSPKSGSAQEKHWRNLSIWQNKWQRYTLNITRIENVMLATYSVLWLFAWFCSFAGEEEARSTDDKYCDDGNCDENFPAWPSLRLAAKQLPGTDS